MKYVGIGLMLLCLGCSVRVIQFVNDDASFKSFEKYILLGMKGKNVPTSETVVDIRPRIENAIEAEMDKRNYQVVSDEPDLIVRYELVSGTVTQRNTNNNMFGGVPGMTPMINYSTAIESVLLIEILSANTQKLVWQASVDLKDLSRKTKRKDVLKAAVESMFNTYLYEAGKQVPNPELISNQ